MISAALRRAWFVCFIFIVNSVVAQPFWMEDFGEDVDCTWEGSVTSFSSDNGAWSATQTGINENISNEWYVSARELGRPEGACGGSCLESWGETNRSLHISSSVFGDAGAVYVETGFGQSDTDVRAESPAIDCSGRSNITLNMIYLAGGNPPSDQCTLEYFDGLEWSEVAALTPTALDCAPKGLWTSASFSLPQSADNNPNVRIGFRWVNIDDGIATDPSVAINNVSLSGTPISDNVVAALMASTTSICMNECISFTDISVGFELQTWTWLFEGAETTSSQDQHPSGICYTSEGTFDVTLIVSNDTESDTLLLNDFIIVEDCSPQSPGTIYIGVSSEVIEVGQCVNFMDNSNAPASSQRNWTFQGGSPGTSNEQNPSGICYSSPGVYDVTLSVTVNNQTFDSTFADFITVEATAGDFPELSISATNNVFCIGDCIDFSDQSANESLSNWQWTFEGGDPAMAAVQNPEEVCYLDLGSYNVTLQVDYQGQTYDSTFSNFITVIDTCGPVANFEFTPIVCLGYCYDFENTSIDGDQYFWTFEGAETSTSEEENPEGICYLDQTGVFNVILTAVNEFGSSSSITQQLVVVNPSSLDAGPDQSVSSGETTVLSATSSSNGVFFWEPASSVECADCAVTATLPILETTVFTVSFEASGGCLVKDSLTVFVPVSVTEYLEAQITLFPNPAKDMVTIELPRGQWQLNLMDAVGKNLQSIENITDSRFDLELRGIAPGAYFVQVISHEGSVVKKLVVE